MPLLQNSGSVSKSIDSTTNPRSNLERGSSENKLDADGVVQVEPIGLEMEGEYQTAQRSLLAEADEHCPFLGIQAFLGESTDMESLGQCIEELLTSRFINVEFDEELEASGLDNLEKRALLNPMR